MKRKSGGVALYFKGGIEYYTIIEFETNIECSICRAVLENKVTKKFLRNLETSIIETEFTFL